MDIIVLEDDVLSLEAEEERSAEERRQRVEDFAVQLVKKRTEDINARAASGVEGRWMADLDAYNGRDRGARSAEIDEILRGEARAEGKVRRRRSTVYVQITRQKTNTGIARLQDLIVPSDERNWTLEPTPVPELTDLLTDHAGTRVIDPGTGPTGGQELKHPTEDRPLTAGDLVADILKQARKKAHAMQDEIDDQHAECQYNDQCRKAIEDAGKLGTGILKGPVIVNRVKKVWKKAATADGQPTWRMEIVQNFRPATFRVDPWNFFPAAGCGSDHQKGGHCWEREPVSPQTLRELAQIDGYDADRIRECLKEGPKSAFDMTDRRSKYIDAGEFDTHNFDLWNYTGEVDVEDLKSLGVEVDEDMELTKMSAVVVMCNNLVLKAIINPLETGDLPYDVFVWDTLDDTPWGVGVPYMARYAQRSLNAAWRQMQDNAGVSHGPQIVVDRSKVEPADGQWDIHGMKLWYTRENKIVENVTQAFGVYQINSNQPQLQAIIEMCLRFFDDETAIPMLAQGERGSAPDKVGIVSMLMNASNVVLKRLARNWDGRITNPGIRRYYDWNMQYSEKDDLKGDYMVHALGSTTLVVRDQQKQDIANLMAQSQDPAYRKFVNPQKVMEYSWRASSIPDVLYTDDEIKEMEAQEANQPAPQDPRIQAAEVKAKADAAIAQMKAEGAIAAEQTEAESERVNQELRMEEAKRNDEREIYRMELAERLEILKMANAQNMQVAQIKAQLAQTVMKTTSDQRKSITQKGQQQLGPFRKPAGQPPVRPQ